LDLNLMRELSVVTDSKIVLLVLDGLGGLPMDPFGRTELEAANAPNFDALAARSDLGLHRPVAAGVSPGSGPGHLGLFGYNPLKYKVGRGVLSALGVGFELEESDLAARINFATKDEAGKISDRRAGRIPTEEASKLVDLLKFSSRTKRNTEPSSSSVLRTSLTPSRTPTPRERVSNRSPLSPLTAREAR
jgi:2,3-bisphosphoglycerate-independent phosphoglycerate mutase